MSMGDSVKPSQAYERLDEIYRAGAIDDFNFRTGRLTDAWSSAPVGCDAVAPIFRFMEDHPDIDYGVPGSLVHFIETFQGRYEPLLLASLQRKPVLPTVWMLNRLINGTHDPAQREKLLAALARTVPSEDELSDAIEAAVQRAVSALFAAHPERFYYCSIITTGEAHPPTLTACSVEALEREAAKCGSAEERMWLEWSYGESPYFMYGDEHFSEVRRLFSLRPDTGWEEEYELRLRAMETAMARLDAKGLFGVGKERLGIVINAEVMPPDYTNTQRALRLNPTDALTIWLKEVAEPLPE